MSELFQWLANLLKGARFWAIVQPWEKAVRVRAGKHTAVWPAGLHLRIPYLDEVTIVNNRLRIAPVPCQTLSTRDGKAVTVAALIGFRITDPLSAMLALQAPEMSCAAFVQTAIAKHVVERTVAEINIGELERAVLAALVGFGGGGLNFDFVSVVDYAVVKTFRLLQEQWRPQTPTP